MAGPVMNEKSPDAFRTISEVADDLDLPQHVLRFWETRFGQIKPLKRGGGRRYYRPDDVELLRGIKHLLYEEGYTIRGLQRILKEQGNRFVMAVGRGEIDEGARQAIAGAEREPRSETEPSLPGHPSVAAAPGRKAVTVAEFAKRQGDRAGAALGKLRGKAAAVQEPESNPLYLGPDDRRVLQETLYELLECKRLLDHMRAG
jgi:DNA-binding transcriptional MerR regulator